MCRQDPLQLWIWLSHYAHQLGEQACFVLYEPGDESIDFCRSRFPGAQFRACPSPRKEITADHYHHEVEPWRLSVVREWQEKLLRERPVVIFADTDELLVPYEGLAAAAEGLLKSDRDRIRSTCFSPHHMIDSELPLRREPGEKWLMDRSQMFRLPAYDKTLMVTRPQRYSLGFHVTYGPDGTGRPCPEDHTLRLRHDREPPDPSMPMVHSWKVDFDDWAADGRWRYSGTEEQMRQYFRDNDPFWAKRHKDEQGDPLPIHLSWKEAMVLR